jgi:hypothetical protein
LVHGWLRFSSVDLCPVSDHFDHYVVYDWVLKGSALFFALNLVYRVWVISQEQNDRVFNRKEKSMHPLFDKVKYLSLWWLKHKAANVSLEFVGW